MTTMYRNGLPSNLYANLFSQTFFFLITVV